MSETGLRTIFATPSGVSILAAAADSQGAASVDAVITRAEQKLRATDPSCAKVDRVPIEAINPDRSLRDAWRVNPLTGGIVVDLSAARRIRARQWWSEAKELRTFITDQLLPVARLLRDAAAETRLRSALVQIDVELTGINKRIGEMTELELATHKPSWPRLKEE